MKDELEKVTLNLRKGDTERLRELYPNLAYAYVIREIVSKFIEKQERSTAKEVGELTVEI